MAMWGKDMEGQQGYGDGVQLPPSEGRPAPSTSSLHTADKLVIISTDETCAATAESLLSVLKREAASTNRVTLEIDLQSVGPQEHHRDVLEAALARCPNVAGPSVFILSFVKDGNPEEYKLVKQWTSQFKPPLSCHVITCTNAMKDPSLLIRNVGKAVILKLTQS
eukprot:TRINITY_DN17687_c0_g1_i1.p1 TRINITY_DN17687_c0_g1~~TRINITY_DN17687_c0_g1_i1.p1  ORF type:complete len:165 (+),score=36.25 TRINITY_DN17687_c0_g1_i1:47-541(+)